MTGDGPPPHARATRGSGVRLPCRRAGSGRLVVMRCCRSTGDPDPTAAADRLAAADVVFAAAECEPTVLFYAEAWRVEPLTGGGPTVAAWFGRHPAGTAAVVVPGDSGGQLLADLQLLLPALHIERATGMPLVPPRPRRLGRAAE